MPEVAGDTLTTIDAAPAPAVPARSFWERTVRIRTAGGFLAGFAWDSLTLTRVDRLGDNLLLLFYLAMLGGLMVVVRRVDRAPEASPRLARRIEWLRWARQFLFGGLYSAYFIYYTKSTSIGRSLLFVFLLFALFVANEFLSHRLRHERLQLALYCLCCFSFLLFFVPVATGFPGPGLFLIAAVGAFLATLGVGAAVLDEPGQRLWPQLRSHAAGWAGLLVFLGLLVVAGLVPPVPLALMGGGIFHRVEYTPAGYLLTWERTGWSPFDDHEDHAFRQREGDAAWCFSAVFAPTGMAVDIVHVWERWDEEEGWVQTDRIPFSVQGGRAGGYRGYTRKRHLAVGSWRVLVETAGGRELGRYRFEVLEGPHPEPALATRLYQ